MSARSLKKKTTPDNEMLPQGTKQHKYWKIKVSKIKIKQNHLRRLGKKRKKKNNKTA